MAKKNAKANKKLIITLAVLLLAAILTVIAAIGSLGFTKKDFKTWFNNWGKPTSKTEAHTPWGGVIDNVGNEMNARTTYAMPAAMAFYATTPTAQAEQLNLSAPSVTVTCSHNFEFNNVLVDWSIEYPSGASATDIVTVTPTGDGSLTANVSCSAPFDTQLTLKATLRGNAEKTATCTIDYIKRISSIEHITVLGSDFDDESGIGCELSFGTGTVNGNVNVEQVQYYIVSDFQSAVQSYLKFNITFKSYVASDLLLNDTYFEAYGEVWAYNMFIEDFDNYDETHKNAIYYAWHAAYLNGNYSKQLPNILIDIDLQLLYNGNTVQTISESDYSYHLNKLSGSGFAEGIAPDLTLNTNVAL